MKKVPKEQCRCLYGGLITPQVLLLYLMIAAGAAGIYKILRSSSGKLSITGITFQWSK